MNIKKIKQIIKDTKEGKLKRYNSVEKLIKDIEKEDKEYKKKYPIRWFFKDFYYALYRFWNHRFRYLHKEIKWFFQRGKRGFYLPKMNKDFRKKHNCLNKREDNQIKEAFDLFKEYFFSLWD